MAVAYLKKKPPGTIYRKSEILNIVMFGLYLFTDYTVNTKCLELDNFFYCQVCFSLKLAFNKSLLKVGIQFNKSVQSSNRLYLVYLQLFQFVFKFQKLNFVPLFLF